VPANHLGEAPKGINPNPQPGLWKVKPKSERPSTVNDGAVTKDRYIPQRNPVQVRKAAPWTKNLPWSSCENLGIIIWLVRARRSMGCRNPCKLSFEKQNSQIQDTTLSKKW